MHRNELFDGTTTPILRVIKKLALFSVLGLFFSTLLAWIVAFSITPNRYVFQSMQLIEKPQCSYTMAFSSAWCSEKILFARNDPDSEHYEIVQRAANSYTNHPDHRWADYSFAMVEEEFSKKGDLGYATEAAFGWPFLSLSYSSTRFRSPPTPSSLTIESSTEYSHAIVLIRKKVVTGPGSVTRALPLRPHWLGLIANTLLYGAALWVILKLVMFRPVRLIRGMRIASGRCAYCGYELRADSLTCSECGKNIADFFESKK